MAEVFKCPACTAPLEYEGTPMQKCEFCGSNVIVPGSVVQKAQAAATPVSATSDPFSIATDPRLGQIRALLNQGNKIEAIKVFREVFGCSLKDAKESVEALERGQPIMLTSVSQTAAVPLDPATVKKAGVAVGGVIAASVIIPIVAAAVFLIGGLAVVFLVWRQNPESYRGVYTGSKPVASKGAVDTSVATEILKFGGEGIGAGKFDDNRTIAVDSSGRIYSADFSDGRVQMFSPEGEFIRQIVPDAKQTVDALVVDRAGTLFVLQGDDVHRVNVESGQILGKTRISNASDMAIGLDGRIFVSTIRGDVEILGSDGGKTGRVPINKALGIEKIEQIAVDGSGALFLLGGRETSIFKVSADGQLLAKFGGRARGEVKDVKDIRNMSKFTPNDLAVDSKGRVYTAEVSSVTIFDGAGNFLSEFRTTQVMGITINDKDEVFVAARPYVIKYRLTL